MINANDTWRQAMVTLTLSVLLIATLAAVVNRSREFALGFAVSGWIYLLLAFVPAVDLRHDLLTDKGVRWLYTAIHDEKVHRQDYVETITFSPDGRRIATSSRDNTVRLWNAAAGNWTDTAKFHEFADICHAAWVLIVACLGGAVAGFLARKNNDESVSTPAINQTRQFHR